MESKEYIQEAIRTESTDFDQIVPRIVDVESHGKMVRLLHAALGMVTESAEFADILKKNFYYGKTIDPVHMQKEIGDLMWYVAVACSALGVDLSFIMRQNIDKLKARYPEKFNEDNAINRKEGDI